MIYTTGVWKIDDSKHNYDDNTLELGHEMVN